MIFEDKSPPYLININNQTDKTSVEISWETDEPSDSRVLYGLDESYGSEKYESDLVTSHFIEITGLEIDSVYHFCVNSTDENGNYNQSGDFIFQTPDDIPPEITNIEVNLVTKNSARISWTTNELSDSFVHYGESIIYNLVESKTEMVTSHVIDLIGLDKNKTYHFAVKSTDEFGNENISEDDTFTTLDDTGDTEPPENPTFSPENGEKVNNKKPTITITFSEEVTITVAKLNGYDIKDDLVSTDYTIYTYTPTENLSEGENTISVKAKDMVGNEMSGFATSTFTLDTIPPEIFDVEVVEMEYDTYKYKGEYSATITWKTDEPSYSIIEYYVKEDFENHSRERLEYNKIHNLTLRSLNLDTLYYFIIKSEDESKNVNISKVYNFTTLGKFEEIDIDVSIKISKEEIKENENITITATVTNKAVYSTEISIIFMINDEKIGEKKITVIQKKSKDISISWKPEKGNHTIKIIVKYNGKEVPNGTAFKNIEVKEASNKNGDSGFNLIFLIPILIIPIIVITGLLMRNRGSKEIQQIPIQQNISQQPITPQQPIQTQTNIQKTATPVQSSSQPGTKICPYCNAQVPGEYKFCNMCGKVIENEQVAQTDTNVNVQSGFKICPFCNSQVPSQFSFCNMCGKEIRNT